VGELRALELLRLSRRMLSRLGRRREVVLSVSPDVQRLFDRGRGRRVVSNACDRSSSLGR